MAQTPLRIDRQTARRFVLGRQGLWPGRRWSGKDGASQAMLACEYTQLDPLRPVARSHDLMLHSRVAGYREGMFEELLYRDRRFFDWGGWLAAMPMEELPHWRVMMARHAASLWGGNFATEHAETIEEVRTALRERGPLMNRDFTGPPTHTGSYRSGKTTGLALYYLWIVGEVMTFDRRRFERVYHLREHVAPVHLQHSASPEEAEHMIGLKQVKWNGFCKPALIGAHFRRKLATPELRALVGSLISSQELSPLAVEGHAGDRVVLASDLPTLERLSAGEVPKEWTPISKTTDDEAVFLCPLDVVSARGRSKTLFEFEYIWEVYKPAHLRRWGYYTMPILYGDQLVGRIEPRLDRKTETLHVDGLWLEDVQLGSDKNFGRALAAGIKGLAKFAGVERIDPSGIPFAPLKKPIG